MVLFGKPYQFRTVIGNQFLIGSADAFPRKNRLFRERIGRIDASHRLTDYGNFRIFQNRIEIMYHFILVRIARKVSQIQNIFDIQLRSRLLVDVRFVCLDYFDNAASYCTIS